MICHNLSAECAAAEKTEWSVRESGKHRVGIVFFECIACGVQGICRMRYHGSRKIYKLPVNNSNVKFTVLISPRTSLAFFSTPQWRSVNPQIAQAPSGTTRSGMLRSGNHRLLEVSSTQIYWMIDIAWIQGVEYAIATAGSSGRCENKCCLWYSSVLYFG